MTTTSSLVFLIRDILKSKWVETATAISLPTTMPAGNIVAGSRKGELKNDIITVERYRKIRVPLDSVGGGGYEKWELLRICVWVKTIQDGSEERSLDNYSQIIEQIVSNQATGVTGVTLWLDDDPARTEDLVQMVPDGWLLNEIHVVGFTVISAT